MSDHTMTAAQKARVKDALLIRAQAAVAAMVEEADPLEEAGLEDPVDNRNLDDEWQADTDNDLAGVFEQQAARLRAELRELEELDLDLKTVVEPGAIVGYDGLRNVVGIVGEPLEVDGATYEGISTSAPIYQSLAGLKLGDKFTFRGHEYAIDFLA